MTNALLFLLAVFTFIVHVATTAAIVRGGLHYVRLRDYRPRSLPSWPRVSIIVAARNEQRNVEAGVRSLLGIDYEDLEVLVVDDRSTDQTGQILDDLAAGHAGLVVYHVEELPAGWLGKNHALHFAAGRATGQLLLFTDADVVMHPLVLRRAVSLLLDQQLDHLSALPQPQVPGLLMRAFVILFSLYLSAYFRPWNVRNPNSASHLGVGAFNLIRAAVYRGLGGHEPIRMRPDDDIQLGKLVKLNGFVSDVADGVEMVRVPWYGSLKELIRGLEKNMFAGVEYSAWMIVGSSLAGLLLNFFPFVAIFLLSGWTWWLYLLVAGNVLLLGTLTARTVRIPVWAVAALPLAVLLFVYIQWRTMLVNLAQGGLRWRDTFYSLDELKANRVPRRPRDSR